MKELHKLIEERFLTLYCGTISILLELNLEQDIIYILHTNTLKLLGVVNITNKEIIYRDINYLEDIKECIDTYIHNNIFNESDTV